jgi:uncharacterized membrane protein YfcA
VLGALFVHFVPDVGLKKFIGVILVVMLILQLWSRRKPAKVEEEVREMPPAATIGTGVGAGFTTMTANAAGPIMSLYLLAARVDKTRFLGTGAFYYLIINLTKVPFSAALGLFHVSTLWLTLILLPGRADRRLARPHPHQDESASSGSSASRWPPPRSRPSRCCSSELPAPA